MDPKIRVSLGKIKRNEDDRLCNQASDVSGISGCVCGGGGYQSIIW